MRHNISIRAGFIIAIVIGSFCYALTLVLHSHLLDPLLLSLLLGITVKSTMRESRSLEPGIHLVSSIFLPVGIVFYGLHNLNFVKLVEVEPAKLYILIVVMMVYFIVILSLGKILRQREQITYLTASGSAICGASAIAVTSPAIDADPDDISISLLSVAIAAFSGFALILPFVAALLNLQPKDYSFLTGSTLQFTGLVKVAEKYIPFLKNNTDPLGMMSLALSLKAVRYLGLLVAVPLFSSLIKKKLSAPWFLWAFIAAGSCGTWIYTTHGTAFHSSLVPYIKPVHTVSWSVAMAAIGLRADARQLLSNNGAKALIMAFAGFFSAIVALLVGLYVIS